MRTSISSALFAVVAALSTGLLVPPTSASPIDLTDSTPTVTHQEVARSFASGGSTCYYTCPSTSLDNSPFLGGYTGYVTAAHLYGCEYSNYLCLYDLTTGNLYNQNALCPNNAAVAGCSLNPPSGDQYFKRSSDSSIRRRRILTPAEEAIAKRQFKPSLKQ